MFREIKRVEKIVMTLECSHTVVQMQFRTRESEWSNKKIIFDVAQIWKE